MPESEVGPFGGQMWVQMMTFALKTRNCALQTRKFALQTRNFALRTRNFALKTRNCALRTRNCALKTRNSAAPMANASISSIRRADLVSFGHKIRFFNGKWKISSLEIWEFGATITWRSDHWGRPGTAMATCDLPTRDGSPHRWLILVIWAVLKGGFGVWAVTHRIVGAHCSCSIHKHDEVCI